MSDDFRPLFDVAADACRERFWRGNHWIEAKRIHLLLDLGRLYSGLDCPIEQRDDILWRTRRNEYAENRVGLLIRYASLRERWHVGQRGRALCRGHGKGAQGTLLDVRNGWRQHRERNRRMSGYGRLDCGCRAAEWHSHEIDVLGELEQLAGKLRRRTDARMREAVLAWISLEESDQLFDVVYWERRMDHQYVRRDRGECSRRTTRLPRRVGEPGFCRAEGQSGRPPDVPGRQVLVRARDCAVPVGRVPGAGLAAPAGQGS